MGVCVLTESAICCSNVTRCDFSGVSCFFPKRVVLRHEVIAYFSADLRKTSVYENSRCRITVDTWVSLGFNMCISML
jgi:hypothetical protein